MIECEVNYIFTNNADFYENLEHNFEKEPGDDIVKKHPIVAILKKRVLSYYKVVVKNLREVIPKNVKRLVLEIAIKDIEF